MANQRRRKRTKLATPRRLLAQHNKKIFRAAANAGMPEIQRRPSELTVTDVPQVANEPTPIKETVRRLTRIEKLASSGVLEPHMKQACEWYSDRHAIGFDGSCRTSNFEGGSGGGGDGGDHLARSKREMMARDDYRWARSFIPPVYVELFESIIIRSDTISAIAAESFADKARSQAEHKTRAALQLCCNLLYDGIKAVLPYEEGPPSKPPRAAATAVPATQGTPAPRRPVTDDIHLKLDDALLAGIPIATIHLGHVTAEALTREAPDALDQAAGTFRDIPIVVRTWPWGAIPQPPAEQASQAA